MVNSPAQEWYRGEGLVLLSHLSPEQARAEALSLARQDVLEQAGVEIRSVTAHQISEAAGAELYDNFTRFSRSIAKGRIVEELIEFDDLVRPEGIYHYKVTVKALVAMEMGAPDPEFQLEVELNQQSYRDGETMQITLHAGRDCYVTLLNLTPDDSLRVVVPNVLYARCYLAGGDEDVIPPKDAGWELPVSLPEGQKQEDQAIMAIATRDDRPFLTRGAVNRDNLMALGDALTAINRWLIDIPADRRCEAMAYFKVVE